MDGSRANAPPVALDGSSDPAVLTKVRALGADDVRDGTLAAACLAGPAREAQPTGRLVERTGVHGASVTLRDRDGLYACDDSLGHRPESAESRRFCGSSFGRIHGGHLRDPRLDIGWCTTDDGKPMAFLWVEPAPEARYLVVEQPGYDEVYTVAGALPVRVATVSGLRSDPLGAFVDVTENDAAGRRLREYRVHAVPAG